MEDVIAAVWLGDLKKFIIVKETSGAPAEKPALETWLATYNVIEPGHGVEDRPLDEEYKLGITFLGWAQDMVARFPDAHILYTQCSCCCGYDDVRESYPSWQLRMFA